MSVYALNCDHLAITDDWYKTFRTHPTMQEFMVAITPGSLAPLDGHDASTQLVWKVSRIVEVRSVV